MLNKRSFLRTWLGLTLAGGLGYTFLRALATMIALGTPWYDWQWYVPLTAFLIGLALQVAWSWPPPRPLRWIYVGLLAWLIGGCSPPGLQEHLVLAGTPPVTISFWAYTDFRQMPEPVLADLRASHALLYLHAPTQTFDGDSGQNLASGLRRLAAQNIPVVLMPPASDFLSTPVRREWIARAQLAAAFLRRDRILNVRGLIGDAEIPMHAPLDLMGTHAADVEATTRELRVKCKT